MAVKVISVINIRPMIIMVIMITRININMINYDK